MSNSQINNVAILQKIQLEDIIQQIDDDRKMIQFFLVKD